MKSALREEGRSLTERDRLGWVHNRAELYPDTSGPRSPSSRSLRVTISTGMPMPTGLLSLYGDELVALL